MAKWRDTPYKKYCHDADATRDDYLKQLAEDYGVDHDAVLMMADLLGPDEDFDGLVSSINDITDYA